MLRAILILGFVLGLAIIGVFSVRWLQPPDNEAVAIVLPACDLLGPPCEWETAAGLWSVSMQSIGDEGQGTEYRLTVSAPATPQRFIAVLRGESMYMGEYPVPLRRGDDGQYLAQFVAPLCTTGAEMVWRVDLQSGQQPLSESVPLKLVFQSEGH